MSAAGAHLHLTESLCPTWNVSLAANAPGKSSFSSEAHCTCVSVSQLRIHYLCPVFSSLFMGVLGDATGVLSSMSVVENSSPKGC